MKKETIKKAKTTNRKGRPSKLKSIDSPIVQKLVEAFKNDFTVEEACSYAGIAKDTYYRWLAEKRAFSDEMEGAKYYVAMEAKKVIKKAVLKGDLNAAKWLLERRQRKLYGKSPIIDLFEEHEPLTEEEQALLDKAIEENL